MQSIDLTPQETEILAQINLDPPRNTEREEWIRNGEAVCRLMKSLIARDAIPEPRIKFFDDPSYLIGGRGRSRLNGFEKNGPKGDAIFKHPNFLKYLRYFLFGANLPPSIIAEFTDKVSACGGVTSGDVLPLGAFARQQTRSHGLNPAGAAEEFYKLALDLELCQSDAALIRNSVKQIRR